MVRVEFHCHTIYSKDSLTTPAKLVETCRKKDIDRVAITDHNTIAGARLAQAIDPERVIIGEEIMTSAGEILAFFVTEEIPAGLTPQETIKRLRSQEAFISVSHPFDRLRNGHWKIPDLLAITSLVDAIETFNARCMFPTFNQLAQRYAQQHNLPGTAGSDAHAPFELGKANLLLPEFNDSASLRAALPLAQFLASHSAPWVHLVSRWAVWRKKRNPALIPYPK